MRTNTNERFVLARLCTSLLAAMKHEDAPIGAAQSEIDRATQNLANFFNRLQEKTDD